MRAVLRRVTWLLTVYCAENSPEKLPLHTDFQRHARAFVRAENKQLSVQDKFSNTVVLIRKLE